MTIVSALILGFLGYLVISLPLAILVGWFASLKVEPFRSWADHPWLAFWIFSPFWVAAPFLAGFKLTPVAQAALIAGMAVSVISGVHGLAYTWSRSRARASVILSAVAAVSILPGVTFLLRTMRERSAVAGLDPSGLAGAASIVGFGLLVIASWALLATVAGAVTKRLMARKRRKESVVEHGA